MTADSPELGPTTAGREAERDGAPLEPPRRRRGRGKALGRRLDLVIAAGALIATAAVLPASAPQAVRIALGLPLLLVLPGLALSRAILPGGSIHPGERLALSLGLSIAAVAVASLALNLSSWGLSAPGWALASGAITVVASVVAAVRRVEHERPVRTTPVPRVRHLLPIALAVVVAAGAVVLARRPLSAPPGVTGYTQLWLVPDANHAELGVASYELKTTQYRLEVLADGRLIRVWSELTLTPGRKWTTTIRPVGQIMDARLYRADQPSTVYRQVRIDAAAIARAPG